MLLRNQGVAVEGYARWLAGYLGVPDFVYRPAIIATGSGSRELGDGLLVAGIDGLVIQVKSRHPEAARDDDLEAAERWCQKHAARARRQALGTRKRLAAGGIQAVSLRGYERLLPAAADWPLVVILSHPLQPAVSFELSTDTLYLSLDDWLGLHSMIRSTQGLIAYVRRAVAAGLPVPLGRESNRYRELAAADLRWASFSPTAVPVLPAQPLTGEDLLAADLFSELMDIVADPSSVGWDSEQYLRFIERLDRTPTLARVQIGRKMMRAFKEMVRAGSRRSFGVMDRESGARLVMLYDYDEAPVADLQDRYFAARLTAYTTLRHTHAIEAGLDAAAGTLGVGIVHHPHDGRRYNFALIEGDLLGMPPDMRASLEEEFGIFDGTTIVKGPLSKGSPLDGAAVEL
jgi:hypothetical protein